MTDGDSLLHVDVQGEGDPVLLIHGFGASGFTWRHWTGSLANHHQAHVVDLKGFGAAPKPRDGAYSPFDQTKLLTEYVLANALESVTLVGHSLGGGIAMLTMLHLARAGAAERVSRIVVVSGAVYPQSIPFFISLCRIPLIAPLAFALTPLGFLMRRVLSEVYADDSAITAQAIEGYAAPLRDARCRYATIETARQIVPPEVETWTDRYPTIEVPTLLIHGEEDVVVPSSVARRLVTHLPDARLEMLSGCGHVPPEERPQESLDLVLRFLENG